jgi:hypothetical protein
MASQWFVYYFGKDFGESGCKEKGEIMIGDHYPAGMSECDRNGIDGNCGLDCGVFLRNECEMEDEIVEDLTLEDLYQLIQDGWLPRTHL